MNIFFTLITVISEIINVSSQQLRCEEVNSEGTNSSEWLNISSLSLIEENIHSNCWLFNAASDEIVQIHFYTFNIGQYQLGCTGDRVIVDLHGSSRYNKNPSWTGSLCGSIDQIPQDLYSSGSSLALAVDLQQRKTPKNVSYDFTASYRFIKRSSNFDCKKHADSSSECDCEFTSEGRSMSGQFFSPGYPSGYRANRTVRYCFTAKGDGRVNLIFNEVRLGSSDKSCLDQRDVIRLFEGNGSDNRRLVRVICNEAIFLEYLSSDPILLLELHSATEWPPLFFSANYTFTPSTLVKTKSRNQNLYGGEALRSAGDVYCNGSVIGKEGNGAVNISNSMFTSCSYEFKAQGPTRVKIAFRNYTTKREVNNVHNVSCKEVNGVTTLVWSEGHMDKLTSFCDIAPPIDVMSNGPRLVLTVDGLSNTTQWNLMAEYSFMKNFGVKTGHQLEGFECAFLYDAENWPTGGYFTSPNYPGLYPRDTECHYFFQGMDWQRVKITFNYLDIQGTPPCNMSTGSDYLAFSNCLTADEKLPRKCGRSNFTLISDKKYFRVTFKSNGKLDATGFNASFRFFNDQTFLMTSFNKSSVSLNMIWCMTRTVLKLILLFFLLN